MPSVLGAQPSPSLQPGFQDTHILSSYLFPPRHVHEKSPKLSHKQTNKKISHSPQPGSWFPLDVISPINILFFLTYLLLFFLSLSHVPASGSPPESRPKLRRKGLPSFECSILSCPRLLAEQKPGMMDGAGLVLFADLHTRG